MNDSGQRACPVCGATVNPDDRFCPSCGSPRAQQDLHATGPVASSEQPTAPFASGPTLQEPVPPPPAPPAAPLYSPGGYAQSTWTAPPPPPKQGSNRTWWIVGGIFVFFLLVCCCCAGLVFVTASQDSALQDEIEGTALLLAAFAAATDRTRSG